VTFADYILSLPQSLSSNHPLRPRTAAYATSDDPFTQPQLQKAEGIMVQGASKLFTATPVFRATSSLIQPMIRSM